MFPLNAFAAMAVTAFPLCVDGSASQPEEAPHALDDLIDLQEGVDPEGGPVEHQTGQIAQRDGGDPEEQEP